MDYATVDGIVQRTGYPDKAYWYLLLIKESIDNAVDFLWKFYPGATDALVTVNITMNEIHFHIKVRNTNSKNIPVFQNLPAIFDYGMTYGSKQNQHVISRGLLGDAAKQIGTWPYVLMHTEDDGREFSDKQWKIPLIIRANKKATRVLPIIDKHNQRIAASINPASDKLPKGISDTEIEATWPIVDEVRESLDIHMIERYCRKYTLFATDISFKFRIIAPDSRVEIDAPALHSVSTTWNNNSSIHSYTPEEFTTFLSTVHDKENTTVYDVLRTFKEGTQIPKTPDTAISVAQLMNHPQRDEITIQSTAQDSRTSRKIVIAVFPYKTEG
jgi:hypothetical protein